MGIQKDFLVNAVFSDSPVNWIVHARGFYYSALKLVEATEKLESKIKFISTEEIFNRKYTYKIAVYLLSHSIELLLKSIICMHNKINKSNQLKSSAKYSHNVIDMIDDLIKANAISLEQEDYESLKLVDEYLKWFGRYYCPQTKDIPDVLKEAYTCPNESGLIEFKYKLQYPETHRKLNKLYNELAPKLEGASLTLPYLLHCP